MKKSSNATLVLVALGGALTVFRRVRLYADLCAEQLERDGDLAESLVSHTTPDPLDGARSRIMRERAEVRAKKTKMSKAR